MRARSKCLTVVASAQGIVAKDAAINPAQKATLMSLILNLPE